MSTIGNASIHRILWLTIFCLFMSHKGQSQSQLNNDPLIQFQREITNDFLKKHLKFLASDSLKGRETGTDGEKLAAEYLANFYHIKNVNTGSVNNTYFQRFNINSLIRKQHKFITYHTETSSNIDSSVTTQSRTSDYTLLLGGTEIIDAPIVFAGFGIQSSEYLSKADVNGKWVMIFNHSQTFIKDNFIANKDINDTQIFKSIVEEKGAKGIILIPTPGEDKYQILSESELIDFTDPFRYRLDSWQQYKPPYSSIAVLLINPNLVSKILFGEHNTDEIKKLFNTIKQNPSSYNLFDTNFSLRFQPVIEDHDFSSSNVIAKIEGNDPNLKNEYVVLSAHFDHLGESKADRNGDRIFNGADDNGSGTVALLAIANALKKGLNKGHSLKRSILFIHFTGEEKGLIGSYYFADHPVVTHDQIIANLNIDMIGRLDSSHVAEGIENYIYAIGGDMMSSELESILMQANRVSSNIEIDKTYSRFDDPNRYYSRSDHWNFGRFGTPFIFFFNGVHQDYHKRSDEIGKINFNKMNAITRTIYTTTVLLANTPKRPRVDNQAFLKH